MTRISQQYRQHHLAQLAAANGYRLQRRGIAYHLTEGDEIATSGTLDKVELFLRKAVAARMEAIQWA